MPRRSRFGLWLTLGLVVASGACAKKDYAKLYATQDLAPSYTRDSVANLEHMGANLVDKGVSFTVYSEHATKVQLALFDDPESQRPTRQLDMTKIGNVWSLYVEGVGVGQAYGFIAWGPNWEYDPRWYPGSIYGFKADVDASGNRFNPNKLLMDPYAREIHREHDWSRGSTASGPKRAECDYGAAMKSLVIQSTYAWSDGEKQWREMRKQGTAVGHRFRDLIVYEVHPKGFTADSASGSQHPGTYRGIGEKAAYFKELGITAVELMPVFEKPLDGGYWGYQTIGFFIPEREYASDKERWGPVEEFKWMVDQLHQQGIEVMVDVVFNHTGEGGLWRQYIQDSFSPDPTLDPSKYHNVDPKDVAGLYSFRGLDNQAYYALTSDNIYYWNNTGVGQETRANHTPMRRLIKDSLEYWVSEMHVDGFRFDLAPNLMEKDKDYNTQDDPVNTVAQEIADDPVLQQFNTRIVAEPWSLAAFDVGRFPASRNKAGTGWGEWNGPFRDWWRRFWNGDSRWQQMVGDWKIGNQENGNTLGDFLFGSPHNYQWNNRRPYHSVNFITVHDGFTMYDLESYDGKVNGCGPLDPACCPQTPGICDEYSGEDHNVSRNWDHWWGWVCAKDGHKVGDAINASWEGQTFCTGNLYDDPNDDHDDGRCGGGSTNVKLKWECYHTQPGDPPAVHDAKSAQNESIKRRMMRNLFMAMFLAHGTPMVLGGDEWMRSQLGNNNAYSTGADNSDNWFQWGSWQTDPFKARMHDFVRQAIALRKRHANALAPDAFDTAVSNQWLNADATGEPDWNNTRSVALYYPDAPGEKPLYIIINGEDGAGPKSFKLPAGHAWRRVIDTQDYFDQPNYYSANGLDETTSANASIDHPVPVTGATYDALPHTVVVLEAD